MTTDYVPIDCDQHSVLELLAMRRTRVIVESRQPEGNVSVVEGVVSDVLTREGAEYLILRDPAGEGFSIRLDRLLSLSGPQGGAIWRQKTVSTKQAK
jgi:transcriptional antiterminator Rof (Rho-off)